MKDTIQKARRWLIRKLGGYPDEPVTRFIKIQRETRKIECLRSKIIWIAGIREPDIETLRNYLARNLFEQVTAKMKVIREQKTELGEIHFYTEMWVTFDPPGEQENL